MTRSRIIRIAALAALCLLLLAAPRSAQDQRVRAAFSTICSAAASRQQRSRPAAAAQRAAQRSRPSDLACGSTAWKARCASSPARSSSCSTATSSSRCSSSACRTTPSIACSSSARRRAAAARRRAGAPPRCRRATRRRRQHARPPLRRVRSVAESQCARRAAHARQSAAVAAAARKCRQRAAGRRARRPRRRRAARSVDAGRQSAAQPPAAARGRCRHAARRRAAAAAAAARTGAAGAQLATLPPSASPQDEYDLAYGYVLHKDYALAEQAFRDFLQKYPERAPGARRAILAGREPVPAPALSRRRGILPRGVDQVRALRQGAGRAAAARPVARRAESEGSGLRHARRSRPQISARLGEREARRRRRNRSVRTAERAQRRSRPAGSQMRFSPISTNFPALVLAVSGGPDSTALMVLAARWREVAQDASRS